MKKIVCFVVTLLLSLNVVQATDWMSVVDNWDIDLDSIQWKEEHQLVDVWVRNNIWEDNETVNGKRIEYLFYHELLHPTAKIFITLSQRSFDKKGKTLENINAPYGGQVSDIPPSSFYDYLCDILKNITEEQIEEYKLINAKAPNAFPFGTTFEHPDNDYQDNYPLKDVTKPLVSTSKHKYKEADYINAYCNGKIEYVLPHNNTRVDCVTDTYAIEFDYAPKWKEAIGQALYYAKITGKKPAIAIIMKSFLDEKYINRIIEVDKNITILRIPAFED